MKEQWRSVCYKGKVTNYQISSYGRIYNEKTGKILKGTYKNDEYHKVQLTLEGKPITFPTHRLVAFAFCPNPNNYDIVDHINRDKYDNRAENLRWASAEQNAQNKDQHWVHEKAEYWKGDLSDFKEIPFCDGKYLVSRQGVFLNADTFRVIKGSERNGYKRFHFNKKCYSAHRVVWETFNGLIPKGFVLDHINGNRSDNRLSNLRLATQSDNVRYAYDHGHSAQKEIFQYTLDGDFVKKYDKVTEAANEIGVTVTAIGSALRRKGTCGNSFWAYKELSESEIQELIDIRNAHDPKGYNVSLYNMEGKEVYHYDSITKAAKALGCPRAAAHDAIRNYKPLRGFYWILDSQKDEINKIIGL